MKSLDPNNNQSMRFENQHSAPNPKQIKTKKFKKKQGNLKRSKTPTNINNLPSHHKTSIKTQSQQQQNIKQNQSSKQNIKQKQQQINESKTDTTPTSPPTQ
eukprot:51528_1